MSTPIDILKNSGWRPSRLAKALSNIGTSISPQAISQWDEVPADRVVAVSEVTGIPRQQLRPDLYEGMNAA